MCGRVGVTINKAQAKALFRRFGYDDVMPYERWAHLLITQPSRQLGELPSEC